MARDTIEQQLVKLDAKELASDLPSATFHVLRILALTLAEILVVLEEIRDRTGPPGQP